MNKSLAIAVLVCSLAFSATGCGKREAAPPAPAPVAAPAAPAVPAASGDAAENLGAKIGSSYVETLKQVVAMLNDKPPVADAKAMLADMKAWTIELMVGLGREREALSPADRATVDRVLSNRIAGVSPELFKEYQSGQLFYQNDRELFQLIADFNVISQYANFDLLKKQLPDEAKRLGIK
jgi:hypothetical protein